MAVVHILAVVQGGLMAVLLMILLFAVFISIDFARTHRARPIESGFSRGTQYTTPGYEMLGALAQDGGKLIESNFLGENI
jgi:hypothetical protein